VRLYEREGFRVPDHRPGKAWRTMVAHRASVLTMSETWPASVSEEQYRRLVALAVERTTEAERCAEANRSTAACAMADAGVEAALMAHVCCSTAEVQAVGRWRGSKAAPLDWTLEQLIQAAVALGWLPANRASIPEDEPVEKLVGEVGDAVRFVQYARNLVVHPGKYVRETPWLAALGETEFGVVYSITRAVIDQLYHVLMHPAGMPWPGTAEG
jgi:hypothetical protein